MGAWERLAGLPLVVDGYRLSGLAADVSSGFRRQTTLIELAGAELTGRGEDVVYDGVDHDEILARGPELDLRFTGTFGDFCDKVGELELFPGKPPERDVSRLYRRWAFESAALDLALRQGNLALADALGRAVQPMSFVVSVRLGSPPALDPIAKRLALVGDLRFKLDPTEDWDDALLDDLAATGAVESVDFKALYSGTEVDQKGGPDLYRRVVAALPEAWIEDPGIVDPAIDAVLERDRDRISWDAPIHGIADIEALPFKPKMVNIKPSRLGGVRSLLDTYDHCASEGIGCYGGGQFELGPGRGQNQLLAALFHPDGPNDLAPTGWNSPDPQPPLPGSPLELEPDRIGFLLGADR